MDGYIGIIKGTNFTAQRITDAAPVNLGPVMAAAVRLDTIPDVISEVARERGMGITPIVSGSLDEEGITVDRISHDVYGMWGWLFRDETLLVLRGDRIVAGFPMGAMDELAFSDWMDLTYDLVVA